MFMNKAQMEIRASVNNKMSTDKMTVKKFWERKERLERERERKRNIPQ